MKKRPSADNIREQGGDTKPPPNKKSKYNLRKRTRRPDDTEWIDDDTLLTSDEESSVEEDSHPKLSFVIHFGNKDDEEDEEEPHSKPSKGKKQEDLPIKLTKDEKAYFYKQTKGKQDELLGLMNRVSKLSLDDGEIPRKFKVLQLPISDYMKSTVIKKISSVSEMGSDVGESHKMRKWIDAFFKIPFGKSVPLPVRIQDGKKKCTDFMVNARKIMDNEIYGMVSAKIQILQIIAQWIVNPSSVGNVIALHGPMGVGKTSFARNAIAKVLQRPFEFFSLGGSSDISNFIGHSYTYEGSMWGRIADSLMHAGTMNPVMYFDELDKVSTTPQGEEIISMMIHLTDQSQNSQFHDRYFSGIEFDMSQCLFVFSFNDIDKVHPILRDRMTVIHCGGYNEKDKTVILKEHIWPHILDRLHFSSDEIQLSNDAITYLISEYSKDEKGVRCLIRVIETMMTRLNMLRVTADESMKEYDFYMEAEFPLSITRQVAETLLTNYSKKEDESWKSMYT